MGFGTCGARRVDTVEAEAHAEIGTVSDAPVVVDGIGEVFRDETRRPREPLPRAALLVALWLCVLSSASLVFALPVSPFVPIVFAYGLELFRRFDRFLTPRCSSSALAALRRS